MKRAFARRRRHAESEPPGPTGRIARQREDGAEASIYEPPGSAAGGGGARPLAPGGNEPAGAPRTSPVPPPPPAAAAAGTLAPKPAGGETPESRLFVGVNIKLKGVEISDCDALVIEGQVEATVNSTAMEIAKPGTLRGTAQIETAEIHGEFVGELTARTRLIVHGTGRVSGTIRYGKLIVEEGGEVVGDIKRLDPADATGVPDSRPASSAAPNAAAAGGPNRAPLSPSAERWSN